MKMTKKVFVFKRKKNKRVKDECWKKKRNEQKIKKKRELNNYK